MFVLIRTLYQPTRPTPPSSQSRPGPLLAPYNATTVSRHHRSDSLCHGRRCPSHIHALAAPGTAQAHPFVLPDPASQRHAPPGYRTVVHRRSYPRPREPTLAAYKSIPRAHPGPQATSYHPLVPPQPTVGGGRPSSPSPASTAAVALRSRSSQTESPPSIRCSHPLPLDLAEPPNPSASMGSHRSPRPQILPKPPSATELAAGDPLHPRQPSDHREDHPALADPSLPSEFRGEPPFGGGDHRNPATARTEEEGGASDWSNLTSGPKGPTVSDPATAHAGLSESVKPRVRLLRVFLFEIFFFFSLF